MESRYDQPISDATTIEANHEGDRIYNGDTSLVVEEDAASNENGNDNVSNISGECIVLSDMSVYENQGTDDGYSILHIH